MYGADVKKEDALQGSGYGPKGGPEPISLTAIAKVAQDAVGCSCTATDDRGPGRTRASVTIYIDNEKRSTKTAELAYNAVRDSGILPESVPVIVPWMQS